MKRFLAFFTLFGSLSTLLCCALPALFVSLGAGAAFATLLTHVPQLIWVSEHKPLVFLLTGGLLVFGGMAQWHARNEACPLDPEKAQACKSARRVSRVIYFVSLAVFLIGAGFAFLPELLF